MSGFSSTVIIVTEGSMRGRQRDLDLVLGAVNADAHAFLDVSRGDLLAEADDELGWVFGW